VISKTPRCSVPWSRIDEVGVDVKARTPALEQDDQDIIYIFMHNSTLLGIGKAVPQVEDLAKSVRW
jgi:hypothetical protein